MVRDDENNEEDVTRDKSVEVEESKKKSPFKPKLTKKNIVKRAQKKKKGGSFSQRNACCRRFESDVVEVVV